MKLFTSLLIVATLWSMLMNGLVVAQITWGAQATNPMKDGNTGQNIQSTVSGPALSGIVNHSPSKTAGNAVFFTSAGSQTSGFTHKMARTPEGDYYSTLSTTATQGTLHPYIVRLSTTAAGTRNYIFSSLPSTPNSLFVDVSLPAQYPMGFIQYGDFPNVRPVYTGNEPIRSVSATVLNDTVYIAIGWLNTGYISIISSNNMINFTDQGYAVDSYNVQFTANKDISLFAAASPIIAQTAGTLFLYHDCSYCYSGPYSARVIQAVSFTTNPTTWALNNAVMVADAPITSMTGTAVTVASDYTRVLLVRAGYDPTLMTTNIYYCILTTTPNTLSRTSEVTLVDSFSSNAAETNRTPAVIYDRIAGDSATGGPVSIAWSNYADGLLYSVVGKPFP